MVPDWGTLEPGALAIAVFAFLALFRWRLGMGKTLAASAAAGVAYWAMAG